MQTSDTTWQAYNRYGGGSLYCGGPHQQRRHGLRDRVPGRAAKVSYNRPFDTRDHDPQSFLFNAEYPMVRWLEANGYDVKYWAGVDTDRRGADLVGAREAEGLHLGRATTSTGRAISARSVEAARDAGVNLAFFSGNEMYWKTRCEPSIDGLDHRRTGRWSATRTRSAARSSIRLPNVDRPAPGATRASARRRRRPPGERR